MDSFLSRLSRGEIFIADGASGSWLMSRGLPPGMPPESINLTNPEILEEIARLYHRAGAEIIQTNTFGASTLKLSNYSLDQKMEEINRNAVRAVRKAVGDKTMISASCGPCGKILKPYGDVEPEEVYDSFYLQLQVLITEGVDIVCVETMTDIREAVQAVKAARALSLTVPIMATMTFDLTPRGFFTIMGNTIDDAVAKLPQAGANILGSNCGNGIENMILISREFRKKTSLPLLIQSNAGLPELKNDVPVYPESPEFMAEKSKDLLAAGVSIIGGCCGTTPDHIRAIRKTLKPF